MFDPTIAVLGMVLGLLGALSLAWSAPPLGLGRVVNALSGMLGGFLGAGLPVIVAQGEAPGLWALAFCALLGGAVILLTVGFLWDLLMR